MRGACSGGHEAGWRRVSRRDSWEVESMEKMALLPAIGGGQPTGRNALLKSCPRVSTTDHVTSMTSRLTLLRLRRGHYNRYNLIFYVNLNRSRHSGAA